MKKGSVTIVQALIGGVFLLASSLASAWGISAKQVAVVEERENNHYLEVRGLIEASDKRQSERWELVQKTLDRIAPPTVPKAELFQSKAEQVKKAPLVKSVGAGGEPINEHD